MGFSRMAYASSTTPDSRVTTPHTHTLKAKWRSIDYRLSYQSNGSPSECPTDEKLYKIDDIAVIKDAIAHMGWSFVCWNTDANGEGTSYKPGDTLIVNSDLTLYAIWAEANYSVTFNHDNGDILTVLSIPHGLLLTSPHIPEKEGYTAIGWFDEFGNSWDFENKVVDRDITLTPKYLDNQPGELLVVRFDAKGGYGVAEPQYVLYNSLVNRPDDPKMSGYAFVGWFEEESQTAWNFEVDTVLHDTTFIAKWVIDTSDVVEYSVAFDSTGGSTVYPQTIQSGKPASKPSNPYKAGYTFVGWYKDGIHWDFNSPVYENLTLTAHWVVDNSTSSSSSGGSSDSSSENTSNVYINSTSPQPKVDKMDNAEQRAFINAQEVEYVLKDGVATIILDEGAALTYHVDEGYYYGLYSTYVPGYDNVEVSVPVNALRDTTLIVETDFGKVSMSNEAIHSHAAGQGDNITLRLRKGSVIADLMINGKVVSHITEIKPFTISIPVSVDTSTSRMDYVGYDHNRVKIIPTSIFEESHIHMQTSFTGEYSYIHNPKRFTDIANHWGVDFIRFVSSHELFAGVGNDNFDPNGMMTRAMFVTVLARIDDANLSNYSTYKGFADVPDGKWYTLSVRWADSKGILRDVFEKSFEPDKNITREEMSAILQNYISIKKYKLKDTSAEQVFADNDKIAPWAVEAVYNMQKKGIISGRPGGLFDPKSNATRAEVATIYTNFIRALLR